MDSNLILKLIKNRIKEEINKIMTGYLDKVFDQKIIIKQIESLGSKYNVLIRYEQTLSKITSDVFHYENTRISLCESYDVISIVSGYVSDILVLHIKTYYVFITSLEPLVILTDYEILSD